MNTFAPIVVFAFNRPKHLALTLDSLSKNAEAKDSELFLYIDGARNEQDRQFQQEMEPILSQIESAKKFKSFQVIRAPQNKGLARSIIDGVTKTVNEFGKVIVLEDDMVLSPYFLKFMNDSLIRYETDDRVISIHGYNITTPEKLPETFFMRGADCWGWATWKRGWSLFEVDGSKLLNEIKVQKREKEFNYQNAYEYIGMLEGQISGKNNSWAIRWYASAFLKNKLTLYPAVSLVKNIGFDGSGTHCEPTTEYDVLLASKPIEIFPPKVEHSHQGYEAYRKFFKSNQPSLKQRMISKVKRSVKFLLRMK